MKPLLLLLLSLLANVYVPSQNRTIRGQVLDQDTTEIVGASIYLIKDSSDAEITASCSQGKYGVLTDADGRFEIEYDTTNNYCYRFLEIASYAYNTRVIPITEKNEYLIILKSGLEPLEEMEIYKPAIYLYPQKETAISIKHDFKGTIGTTYPDYKEGWNVTAKPDGSIYNMEDKRSYEYLFWDGMYAFPEAHFNFKDGFVVPKAKLPDFLLKKLTLIGLNNKEINDFIVYWLPILNKNQTNFIHFRINDNIDNSSILHVTPEPDSWIRLFMEFKEVDKDYSIPQQSLKSYPRKGFTLVEWGGGKMERAIKIQ